VRICIPVDEDLGLASPVCMHFGSAPYFMIVNTDDGSCRAIANRNDHHAHGMCQPLEAVRGETIDGMVVGGIGMGALNKLTAAGICVYQAQHPTVDLAIEAIKAGRLPVMSPGAACGGHHGHAGHGHDSGV